jgi:hypothetical protein
MTTLDLFDLLTEVETSPGVVDAQREYSDALKALRAILPAAVADCLWLAVLDVDAAHGRVMVETSEAGFKAAGGKLRPEVV